MSVKEMAERLREIAAAQDELPVPYGADEIRSAASMLEEGARERDEQAVDAQAARDAIIQQAAAFGLQRESDAARLRSLEEQNEKLREALEPFCVGAEMLYGGDADERVLSLGHWSDDKPLPTFYADTQLTVGHVRRARALLSPAEEKEKG